MRTHHQDQVKVAVYTANMPAVGQQRSQDLLLAALMGLSALVIVGLRYLA